MPSPRRPLEPLAILIAIILCLANATPARAQAGLLVYVPNQSTNNVRVFQTLADGGLTPVATIPVGGNPKEALVRADQAFAYVANGTGTISVISTKTNTVIQTIAAGALPWGMAFSPNNSRLYVANRNGDTVSIFSVGETDGQLALLTTVPNAGGPLAAAVTPDGTRLYVANTTGNSVRVFDTSNNAVVTTIPVGSAPFKFAMNPAGTRVYVPNLGSNTVSVIDTGSNTVLGSFPTGAGPSAAAVSPNGSYLYVMNGTDGTISQFNAETLASLAPAISTSGNNAFGLALTPNGSALYATNDQNDLIALFSVGADGALSSLGTQAIGLGNSFPFGVGVCGANGNKLLADSTFVANTAAAIGCTANNPVFTGGTLLINADGLVFPQSFTVGSGGAQLNTGGFSAEFSGLFSGGGGLSKQGDGRLTLSGAGSNSGPITIEQGTLSLTGSLASASSITVQGDGTLEGTGRTDGLLTVTSGGTVSPGITGTPIASLVSGGLTLSSGSIVALQLNGAVAGTSYDSIVVAGNVNLGGATLSLSVGFAPTFGQTFRIVDNIGSGAIFGTFAGLPEGSSFSAGGSAFYVSYKGGTGNDVTLSVLPVTPTLAATASASGGVGTAVYDVASLIDGANPTGTLTFRLFGSGDTSCAGAPVFTSVQAVTGNGSYQSSTFTPSAGGVYRWIASYSGDSINNAVATVCSDPGQAVTIGSGNKTAQTITFGALASKTLGDAPFVVGATASSSLTVTFSSATPSVCAVSNTTVTLLTRGLCTIAADQAGDTTYDPAPTVTQSFTVVGAAQTITFAPLPARTVADSPFTVSATATSGLGVTFSSLTPAVCGVSGNSVILLGAGTCTIAADQSGDGNYEAAPQVTRSFAVGGSCSLSPAQLPVGLAGIPYSATVTLANAAGALTFTGTLPPGLTFSNGVVSGTPTARGAFSITVDGATSSGCQASKSYSLPISAERRLVVGSGTGGGGAARAFNLSSATPVMTTNSGAGFNGGTSVAEGDVDGNGYADVITGAGPGAGPTVTVFDGFSGAAKLAFFAFPSTFTGGVEVAAGDINGDGQPEILAVQACGSGSTSVVRAFDGRTGALVREYPVSPSVAGCGLHVAAGDVNDDGLADVVVGSASLGPSFVRVIDGSSGALIREFFPYTSAYTGGVFVAAGDVTGDGFADVVTGAGPGGTPQVRVFDGTTGNQIAGPFGSFLAYPSGFSGGVRVAAGDLNGDGRAEVITGAGPGGGPHVRVFDGATTSELIGLLAFDPSSAGGVFVAAPAPSAHMNVDIAGTRITGTQVRFAGWAVKDVAADTDGNDAIHVWAYPVSGAAPVFVGAAPARTARPDVAAFFGGEFLMSGFDFTGTLAAGTYDLVIFGRNTRTLRFDQVRVFRVTVQ